MSGKLKQNLFPNQRVTIARTADKELDGSYATVIGVAVSHPECDFYIIGLDTPTKEGWTAIMMIESCLDVLSNGGPTI